jgi:hypothetical protein
VTLIELKKKTESLELPFEKNTNELLLLLLLIIEKIIFIFVCLTFPA